MAFWRNVSPSGAARDFWAVWTGNPYRWRVLALAMLATFGTLWVFIPPSERIPPEKPKITYITTFAEGRSDEEIRKANIEAQKLQDAVEAEEAKRDEARKDIYRTLGRLSGMDVDQMEREIRASEAAEEAAKSKPSGQQPVAPIRTAD